MVVMQWSWNVKQCSTHLQCFPQSLELHQSIRGDCQIPFLHFSRPITGELCASFFDEMLLCRQLISSLFKLKTHCYGSMQLHEKTQIHIWNRSNIANEWLSQFFPSFFFPEFLNFSFLLSELTLNSEMDRINRALGSHEFHRIMGIQSSCAVFMRSWLMRRDR